MSISALLAPTGSPAGLLRAWLIGSYELVVSSLLLAELQRALGYPKLRKRIDDAEAAKFIKLLRHEALLVEDPKLVDDPNGPPSVRSPDPGNDYLIALAAAANAVIVSGDAHLLGLADQIPVYSPAGFLALLER